MTDIKKLKELAERATPGPWSASWEEGDDHLGRIAYFALNGQYNITKETIFDIVNVVPENVCS